MVKRGSYAARRLAEIEAEGAAEWPDEREATAEELERHQMSDADAQMLLAHMFPPPSIR